MKRSLFAFLVLCLGILSAGCGSSGGDSAPAPGEDVTHGKSATTTDTGVKTAH